MNLLTLAQVANQMGCCEKTVRSWIAKRLLPAQQFGRRMWRVREDDLERYIRENTTERIGQRITNGSETVR